MIQNPIFGILFLKALFQVYIFCMFVHPFFWTLPEIFLFSDFLAESDKAKKN